MIQYRWNKEMQKVFDSNKIDLNTEKTLPTSLKKFLNKGIIVVDECYYFKDFAKIYSEDLFDKTGNECFNNKFYIDYYVDIKDDIKMLRIGISFVKCLAHKLESYNEPFLIILGYHDNSIDIRFHKIRKEEAGYLIEDIDSYIEEGIFLAFVEPLVGVTL
jgi:hypothetical protein